jgi:glycosyltransferase involved in cell wall biosynthesis
MPDNDLRRPPISAAIITYNERDNIEQCLDCLSWCDEIVVLDSGSDDGTLDIVRRYPQTQVMTRPFDNFIDQKNFVLDHCSHDWVLSLDADEVLTAPLIEEIRHLSFDATGYHIGRRAFIGEQEIKHGTWSPDYKLRLFRRSQGRWGGSNPHEQVLIDGETKRLTNRMLHFSYRNRDEFVERNRRYTLMMVDHLVEKGKTAGLVQPYLHSVGNFLKAYVLRCGFLDGSAGFFLAYHSASASFMKYRLLGQRSRIASSDSTIRRNAA